MRLVVRAVTIGIFAGVLGLLPLGAAATAAPVTTPARSVGQADVVAAGSGRVYCHSYQDCVFSRSNFVRYHYHVSSIGYYPPDATCPATCGGPIWFFDYWS